MYHQVPVPIPAGVGYSFPLPNLKVTVLDDGPEARARLAADAQKQKKWEEDEQRLLAALTPELTQQQEKKPSTSKSKNTLDLWTTFKIPTPVDVSELLRGNVDGLLEWIAAAKVMKKEKPQHVNLLSRCYTEEGFGIRSLVAMFGSIKALRLIQLVPQEGPQEWSFGNRYGILSAILNGRIDLAQHILHEHLPKAHWGRMINKSQLDLARRFNRVEMLKMFEENNLAVQKKLFDERLEQAKKENKEPLPVWKEAKASYEFPPLTRICAAAVAMMLFREMEKCGRPVSPKLAQLASDDVLRLIVAAITKVVPPLSQFATLEYMGKCSPRFRSVLDFDSRRRIAAQHSTLLRRLCTEHLFPRNPKAVESGLISVYSSPETLESFRFREEDSSEKRMGKYFCDVAKSTRVPGKLAIAPSFEQFRKNLNAFSGGQLRHLNWQNVMVIGGAVGACLLPIPDQFVNHEDRYFNQEASAWSGSDIDLCLYGLASEEQVFAKVREIYQSLVKAYPEIPISILSTREAVTFSRHFPFRPIQIMGSFPSIAEVISDIDIDCTAAAYDGNDVWALPRAREALTTRMNIAGSAFHSIRGCPQYEKRLVKYVQRGFAIGDPLLHRESVIESVLAEPSKDEEWKFRYSGNDDGDGCVPGVGMKLLLLAERYPWVREKLLRMCTDNSIPFGPEWTREIVEKRFTPKPNKNNTVVEENTEENNSKKGGEWNYDDLSNAFDGYTHWYQPPQVVSSIDKLLVAGNLHITGNHRPFLIPKWTVDMTPNEKHRNHWDNVDYDDDNEEESQQSDPNSFDE